MGKAFSMASLSAPLKSQLDNDHKAVLGSAISISFRVTRHRENDACTGVAFLQIFASLGWEVGSTAWK